MKKIKRYSTKAKKESNKTQHEMEETVAAEYDLEITNE